MSTPGLAQVVDPAVSRAKFEREVAQYRAAEAMHAKRGWWLMKAEFPQVLVALVATKGLPRTVVLGVLLDFTNYDLEPPSVRLVDPFTERPLSHQEVAAATPMWRRAPDGRPGAVTIMLADGVPIQADSVLQAFVGELPFVCLPGVREYHDNPAHSGDSWLLHRGLGEGTLYFILDKLSRYGTEPLRGLNIQVQLQPAIAEVAP